MKKRTDSYSIHQRIRQVAELKKLKKEDGSKDEEQQTAIFRSKLIKLDYYQRIFCQGAKTSKRQREYYVKIPKVFSLYQNPEQVLKVAGEISSLKQIKNINSILIDHTNCEEHDLAAEILLATTVSSLITYKKKNGAKFKLKGLFPTDRKMKKLLRSIGVVKEVANAKYHITGEDKLRLFKRQSDMNEKINIFGKDKKTRATEDFVKHLNDCLNFIGAQLDEDEEEKIHLYLGEVLGNAEDHSGTKLWHIAGYLDAEDQTNICSEIVIYSVGNTVFETFEEKKNVPIVYNELEQYVKKHKSGTLSEEQLTMVFALQQNVSSKKDEAIDRGQGTKDLIQLFHHLTNECNKINSLRGKHCNMASNPNMFMLSGSAMLKFDGKYQPSSGQNDKMVYSFNDTNSLDLPPDKNYVPQFKNCEFPGAIIYIRFPLHEETLVSSDET
jgi:hypothetical protein